MTYFNVFLRILRLGEKYAYFTVFYNGFERTEQLCVNMNFLRQSFPRFIYLRDENPQSNGHADRQIETDVTKIIYHAASRVVSNNNNHHIFFQTHSQMAVHKTRLQG